MTAQQIVALAIRLFAIWFAMSGLERLTTGVITFHRAEEIYGYTFLLLPVIQLLLVPLLWMFPLTIAKRIIPVTSNSQELLSDSKASLIRGAVSVMGLWFVASGLKMLLPTIFYKVIAPRTDAVPTFAAHGYEVIDIVSIIVGLIIIINSRSIAMICAGLPRIDREGKTY